MKRTVSYILITMIFALLFGGCGASEEEEKGVMNTEATQKDPKADTPKTPEDITQMSASYTAAVNIPLRAQDPPNALAGGGERAFLGTSGAWYFKKHLYENPAESWDELSFVNEEGETKSESFDLEHQLWDVGPVAGTNHYAVFCAEAQEGDEGYRYFLEERDSSHQALRELPLKFLEGTDFTETAMSLVEFAVDSSGMVHLVRLAEEELQYLRVSPEGELLAEDIPGNCSIERLVPMYDGQVALCMTKRDSEGQSTQVLQYIDMETWEQVLLSAPKKDLYYFTLFDKVTLVYADSEGVYRSGLSGENPELLYRFGDNGITAWGVSAMQADEEGRIMLLYGGQSEESHYLYLEPAEEGAEVCRITLAVSPYSMSAYKLVAAEFNKRYPEYHIELKSDIDKTALLTELIAGKGPVLIDTLLTGFEDQEELWEPLDIFLEQWGLIEELQLSVLELGKIHEIQYGIVTDFRLRTMVIKDSDPKDWDYDTFLQCVEDKPDLEAIFNMYGGDYGSYFIMNILSHGINDSYLLDAEAGTTNFDSKEFHKALELAKKYCVREDVVSPGSSLLEGKVLCNELTIGKPEDLALYRACYGEDANYIGYPTKDGSACFLESGGNPLAIRRTATAEEKAAALAFIRLCLSYEGQTQMISDLNFCLSIRKDVLEEQIATMNETTAVYKAGFDGFTVGDDLNIELDRKVLMDMISKAKPLRYFPPDLRTIFYEELEPYFSGTTTEDMVINHLKNRVELYLGERD